MISETTFKTIIAVIGGFLAYVLGGINSLMIALIIFMVVDYMTGVVAAWYEKKLNSNIGFKGIVRKIMMLCIVVIAVQVDIVTQTNGILRSAAIFFLMANEGLSILENLTRMDIGVPPVLKQALQTLKTKGETDKSDTG